MPFVCWCTSTSIHLNVVRVTPVYSFGLILFSVFTMYTFLLHINDVQYEVTNRTFKMERWEDELWDEDDVISTVIEWRNKYGCAYAHIECLYGITNILDVLFCIQEEL